MRQVRFGSYSTAATLATTLSLVRLKSMTRYRRLWPPPMWRAVVRPWTLRPPLRERDARRDFSGVDLVISEKSGEVWKRRPGLVGLRERIAMAISVLEQRDVVAGSQGDDGPLRVGLLALAVVAPHASDLAGPVEGVDLDDLDAPNRLDRVVDLGLGRARVHLERVDALLDERVALLGDDRRQDDVAGILHHSSSLLVSLGVRFA